MNDPSRPSISELATQCERETSRFFRARQENEEGDSCLQLFRLAALKNDEKAWEAIYRQYAPLVKGWVLRHPAFPQTGEDADFFINMAFSRMWQAMTPEKCQRFDNIKSVLRYLQACTHSAIIDFVRNNQLEALDIETQKIHRKIEASVIDANERLHDRIYSKEALEIIEQRMKTPRESAVLYEAYVLGLKAGDIFQRHPEMFQSVKEVYRVKENILARLRRDKDLRELLA